MLRQPRSDLSRLFIELKSAEAGSFGGPPRIKPLTTDKLLLDVVVVAFVELRAVDIDSRLRSSWKGALRSSKVKALLFC